MRHIPIRDLLDRAGEAVQAMMPCFMMSPLSVAQHLVPGRLSFDLVVMDEASQLRPEDALGAIARGAQVVIVGDPKQLPPTSFFQTDTSTAEDEEDLDTSDESVLDTAMTVTRPPRRLKWHYRSRHGSLIAFSNRQFYDNDLVVFPSPFHAMDDYGVRYERVPGGVYGRSINLPEVRHVAAAAVGFMRRHPDRSLGIVTLNKSQQDLLSLEMDRLLAEQPEAEAYRKRWEGTLEPLFVKNLENVQGDERDAIFISTVYGRDEHGAMHQRFGPINGAGGHRRLNVLFTRAKMQTVIFSSMEPGDIRVDETSSPGLRALRGYLQYAMTGSLGVEAVPAARAPGSDFEVSVARRLRDAGFEVVPQVGVAGYFIDLAVRHPSTPGLFVLGIECDGAMYHSARSTRDRDRLRQEVLERLGWKLHRVWSLDWFRNPAGEAARIVARVKELIGAEQAGNPGQRA
jgi:very-short-patch-repair endonuclease